MIYNNIEIEYTHKLFSAADQVSSPFKAVISENGVET